jgi:hypothetical protein
VGREAERCAAESASIAQEANSRFQKTMPVRTSSKKSVGDRLVDELIAFNEFGERTIVDELRSAGGVIVPVLVNEFWTSKQRAAHPLHEVSYRACFKPALPRFFIERLTSEDGCVYDPFMGRGTTLIEAMLMGRKAAGCDINPVSRFLVQPRLPPPSQEAVAERLESLDLKWAGEVRSELEVVFHPETLREITALRDYLLNRESSGDFDAADGWIRMVATNRLTGHSPGFFSVYTLPPNQAVSLESQRKINEKRDQAPEYRDVRGLIAKKSKQLLARALPETANGAEDRFTVMCCSCDETPKLADASIDLVVTSPPFLDVVDYTADNWLRGWFCGIDTKDVPVWQLRRLEDWSACMLRVFTELQRVLRPGGWLAFEVGEVRGGTVRLEEHVLRLGATAGLEPVVIVINEQEFTKTSNCWGVTNQKKGTNSNRVVLFRRL